MGWLYSNKYLFLMNMFIIFMLSMFFMLFSIFLFNFNFSVVLNISLFNFDEFFYLLNFYFTDTSMMFSSVVTLVTSCVILYSLNYLEMSLKSVYYIMLVYLFMISMLLVINLSNFFYLMLGWDGLGSIPFFLIIFYSNTKSISAGIFSLIMNRIGDSFYIVSIILMKYFVNDLFFSVNLFPKILLLLMMITFMTKTAIFPFSSWLPIAMAAPTPISALVHSSTLVTAGLFLFMRMNYFFYNNLGLMKILTCISSLTSFCAGMTTIFEVDFKKLIALSTLSHLGFILMAFSLGLLKLSFFHLVAHALFKSLLFLSFGGMMLGSNHSQDKRVISNMGITMPVSSIIMLFSMFNLIGMPSFSGFFSKDLILEHFYYTFNSNFLVLILFLNVIFTYLHTYKLFSLQMKYNSNSSFMLINTLLWKNWYIFNYLAFMGIIFGILFINFMNIFIEPLLIYETMKFMPMYLNLLILFMLYMLKGELPMINKNYFIINYFKFMFYLSILQIYSNKLLLISMKYMYSYFQNKMDMSEYLKLIIIENNILKFSFIMSVILLLMIFNI